MATNKEISSLADRFYPEILEIRRYLHAHPELSFEETETARYIQSLLNKWGISFKSGIAGNGIVADLTGKAKGKIIGIRADMDALPVQETNDVPYRSVNPGKMHACGHDVHAASLLGTIRILNELKDQFEGKIRFVFQPGEEKIPGGAKLMLESRLFGDEPPEMMIAQHVYPELESGHVGFKKGVYMASSDEIYITIKGKGGHAALPEKLIDPILIAAHVISSLQQIVSRKAKPGIPTVLSFGKIEGKGAVNVIPDVVKLEGTFRTMDEAWRKEAHALIESTLDGTVKAFGGTAEIEIRHGYPVLFNDPGVTGRAEQSAIDFLGTEKVHPLDIRMTAEDFAYFSNKFPSCMFRLGVAIPGKECPPLHTSMFDVDEEALRVSMGLMGRMALDFLQ